MKFFGAKGPEIMLLSSKEDYDGEMEPTTWLRAFFVPVLARHIVGCELESFEQHRELVLKELNKVAKVFAEEPTW